MRDRVLVVGGGVIGLSCAWQLARRGHDTILVGTSPGRSGAAWVAAGMLAPVTEVQFGERTLTSLLLEGASHWKDFATSLEETTGRDIGYDQTGTITVAVTPSDRAVLLDLLAYQLQLGCTAHRRSVSECRTSVPALAPTLSGGIEVPDDHHVDNRALLSALLEACRSAGVELVEEEVMALSTDNGPTVTLTSGTRLGASTIVLAAGVGTADIAGMEGLGLPEIRPVKGHILRLGPFPGTPQLGRTVRGLVHGRSVYLVPRPDKTLVVGATMEERGRDTTVQAGAVQQLLADARTIVPGVDEMELLEASAGLRPSTADNRPCIGWTNVPGVMAAVGHFRNGILLAPLTAHAVGSLL
ncbi:MAG TPA: glycine oxidase ThiO, partial [Acidimicrobiales bacterium]|nr:glycine oxidase ThiO [Acidimicrobiales bacterium]